MTPEGTLEAALTVTTATVSEGDARQRFARRLERFMAAEPSVLDTPTVVLHLGFDPDSHWGPGHGPLGAPEHLQRPLHEVVTFALDDLTAHS